MNSVNESQTRDDATARADSAARDDDGHLQYLLTAYLLDNISDAGRREVEEHLQSCAECQQELSELTATLEVVEGALCPSTAGNDYSFEERRRQRVLDASRRSRSYTLSRKSTVIFGSLAATVMIVVVLVIAGTSMQARYGADSTLARAPGSSIDAMKSAEPAGDIFYESEEDAPESATFYGADADEDTIAADPAAPRPENSARAMNFDAPALANGIAVPVEPQSGSAETKLRDRVEASDAGGALTEGIVAETATTEEPRAASDKARDSRGRPPARRAGQKGGRELDNYRRVDAKPQLKSEVRRIADGPDAEALTESFQDMEKSIAAAGERRSDTTEDFSAGIQLQAPRRSETATPGKAAGEKREEADLGRRESNRNILSQALTKPRAVEEARRKAIADRKQREAMRSADEENTGRPGGSKPERIAGSRREGEYDLPDDIGEIRTKYDDALRERQADGRFRMGKDLAGKKKVEKEGPPDFKAPPIELGEAEGRGDYGVTRYGQTESDDLSRRWEERSKAVVGGEVFGRANEAKKNLPAQDSAFAQGQTGQAMVEGDEDGAVRLDQLLQDQQQQNYAWDSARRGVGVSDELKAQQALDANARQVIAGLAQLEKGFDRFSFGDGSGNPATLTELPKERAATIRHAEMAQQNEKLSADQKRIAGLLANKIAEGKATDDDIKVIQGFLGGQPADGDTTTLGTGTLDAITINNVDGLELYKSPGNGQAPSFGTSFNLSTLPDTDLHVLSVLPPETLTQWGVFGTTPGNESVYFSAPLGGVPGPAGEGGGGGSTDAGLSWQDPALFAWYQPQPNAAAGYSIENRKRGFLVSDPALEKNLRAYSYYHALDPQLTRESFVARALRIPAPVVGDEGLGRERFRERYGVNPFVDTRRDHESTFAMDVDTASYTRTRALLRSHELPDPKTVRVEEFVNAFQETLPSDPDNAFSVYCEGGPSPFGEDVELIKITAKARELLPNERRPAILTFAIDSSGSMFLEGRLAQVKQALSTLLDSLHEDDRVAIVAYGAQAYLALPHTAARESTRILGALGSLRPSGSTNVEAGLELAYRIADESFAPKALNRVVLCSDGVATSGSRSAEAILEKVKVFARRGIYLSSVGFGRQRYNDAFMERIANEGNGNYAFVDSPQAAEEIFRRNLPSMLQVLARDAKIQVVFDHEVVSHYRLLGYENRDIADKDFRNDKIDAGEVGPGTTVTALYEVRRRPGAHGALGKVHIRFHHAATSRVEELDFPLSPGVLATSLEETSDRFRFIACVAELAELLRESYWARNGSYAEIMEVLAGLDPEFRLRPEISEVTELVLFAQKLTIPRLAAP